jgi:multiple sugar transport system ATP-binding protein
MAELIVKDVALRLGDNEILKGVSLAVPAGEVVALLGPSGSGKTTLLRAVAGLETPHRGSIAIGDRVFFDAARNIDLPAEERGLGLVFQSYALWPHRTVFDNVAYGLKLRGESTEEIKRRVEKTLSQIGLGHLAARYPHQLSGGQQQRVAIARALVYEPPVILLDEPLSNLDAKLRNSARDELKQFQRKLGTTTIYVTHDQAEAMGLGDRIAVLNEGKVIQIGSPQEIYLRPIDTFVATFIGSPPMNLIDDGPSWLGFRPEAFLPSDLGQDDNGMLMPVRVTRVEYLGAERLIYGILEGRSPEAHIISKLPTNVRDEFAIGAVHDFVVRKVDISRFDRVTGRRLNGISR